MVTLETISCQAFRRTENADYEVARSPISRALLALIERSYARNYVRAVLLR